MPDLPTQLAAAQAALAQAMTAAQNADAAMVAATMQLAMDQNAATLADAKAAASQKDLAAKQVAQAQAHVAVTTAQGAVSAVKQQIAAAAPVDLAPLIEQAKPAAALGPFTSPMLISRTVDVKNAGLVLDAGGMTISEAPTAGASSDFIAHAAGIIVKNAKIVKANVAFRIYADGFQLLDSTLDGATSGILTDVGGTRLYIARCKFGQNFQAVPVYVSTDGSLIEDSTFGGAVAEYDLRYDVDSTKRTPIGATVQRCEFFNTAAFGKDTLGFRMIHSMRFLDNVVHGDIRIGQSPPAGFPPLMPTSCCSDCIIRQTTFDKIAVGGGAIRIMSGAMVTVDDCDFFGGAMTDYITIDAGSILTVTNCRQHVMPNVTPKPLISASNTGKWTESGIIVVHDATADRIA